MARRETARTVMRREAMPAMHQGFINGMAAMGAEVIRVAQPPDAEPYGKGLVTTGNWGVWADGKRVAGTASKPRAVKLGKGITLVVGYDFPGRFQEQGVVHAPAQPFLTPAMLEVLPEAAAHLRNPILQALARLR